MRSLCERTVTTAKRMRDPTPPQNTSGSERGAEKVDQFEDASPSDFCDFGYELVRNDCATYLPMQSSRP